MRLKEHVEPPRPATADTAPVNDSVANDALAWSGGNLAAAGVLHDPASLPDALASNPALLQHLDVGDLSDSITNKMDTLSAGNLDGIISSLADADPSKADGLFGKLKEAGSLGSMVSKYISEGIDFVKKVDPSKLVGLVKAFAGGLDFLKALAKVVKDAGQVVDAIGHLELPKQISNLKAASGSDKPHGGGV